MLTHSRITEVLHYDPITGIFTWKITLSMRAMAGVRAGATSHGGRYRLIGLDGTRYTEHRLAWFYMKGEWPVGDIDHRDGDGQNNRLENLRDSTVSQNLANMRKKIKSSTGFRGVYPHGKRFVAKAMKDYKTIRFGIFDTPDEAYLAYCEGAKKLFGNFANLD